MAIITEPDKYGRINLHCVNIAFGEGHGKAEQLWVSWVPEFGAWRVYCPECASAATLTTNGALTDSR